MRRLALVAAVLSILIPGALSAAQITLRDGNVFYGQLVSGTPAMLVFQQANGVRRRVNTNNVRVIDFTVDRAERSGADRMRNDQPYRGVSNPAPGNPDHIWTTLPAGTAIAVRTAGSIHADNVSPGPYMATIAEDVLDPRGSVIIPRGSDAELVVRGIDDRTTLGSGGLILDLNAVRVNGHRYTVDTEDLRASDHSGIGANKRTGEMVGGGAVLGTLLGAIAGGGKGAAIGALAGAAAGGGVQVLTRGKEVRVPAETVLNFRLEEPLRLRDAGY